MRFTLLFTLIFSVFSTKAQNNDLTKLQSLSNSVGNNEDRKAVIEQATKYLKKDSTVSEVYEIRARAYEWIDKEKSVSDYRKAIQLDSMNINALNGLGNVLADLEQYEEALKCYEHALARGGDIGILLNVANLYEEIKDFEGWERTARRMIEPQMDGFNKQLGYFSLARMYKSQDDKRYAVENYIKACDIGDPEGYYLRETALLLIELNRKQEACEYLNRAKSAYDYEESCCKDVPTLIKSTCNK